MSWLVRLYPREWRARYGAELAEVVASRPRSLQLVVDLVSGAIDAHWNPQAFARNSGGFDMTRLSTCGSIPSSSRKDVLTAAGLTIGSALVVAAIMLIGRSPVTETIGLVMFPGVLTVGMQSTILRGKSLAAKTVLIGGPFVVLFLIGLVAGLVRFG